MFLYDSSSKAKFHLKIVLAICILTKGFAINYTLIRTKFGPVIGHEYEVHPISIYVFKNIPYAKQPIGEMRFKPPEETDAWASENDLNQQPIYCPQSSSSYVKSLNYDVFGQEDCLFLDIYVRKEKISSSLPVLIYFHPGRFSYGSKEEYRADFLLKINDMIVVIPNYRLGILGFLSNQDSLLPGNLGLWDQRMAMKWVFENIEVFGGDPQKITIAGHDAGGASVGFHILSPLSHSYFSAAISGSGTALDPWAMSHTPGNAVIVANSLECPTNFSDNMTSCLKTKQLNDILEVQMKLSKVMFLPTTDKAAGSPFLPFPPQILYANGFQKNVSYLAGVTQEEAVAEVASEFATAVKTQHLDKIIHHLLKPYLHGISNFHLVIKAAKYHYLGGVPVPTFESVKPQMVEMMSDFLYVSPLQSTLKWHSKKTQNTFMYVFDYKKNSDINHILNSAEEETNSDDSHMGDAIYLFNMTTFNESIVHNNRINHVKKLLCKIWGNFVNERSPAVPNWKKFNEKERNYVEISTTIGAKINYRRHGMELWTLLVPDLQRIHNISTEEQYIIHHVDTDSLSWGAAGLAILLGVLCIALVGVVIVTRRKLSHASFLPVTSRKDEVHYGKIGEYM